MCFDAVLPCRGARCIVSGNAVLCGALAAVGVGGHVAVATCLAPQDEYILGALAQQPCRARHHVRENHVYAYHPRDVHRG
jgi:hypothetical protein